MSKICFKGKTFIVAGSGGIGAATAIALNEYGAKIIVLDVNEDSIKELLLKLHGENASYVCDLSAVECIESIVKNIIKNAPDMTVICHYKQQVVSFVKYNLQVTI